MNTQKRNCPPEPSLGSLQVEMQRIIVFIFLFSSIALFTHTCLEQTKLHMEVFMQQLFEEADWLILSTTFERSLILFFLVYKIEICLYSLWGAKAVGCKLVVDEISPEFESWEGAR